MNSTGLFDQPSGNKSSLLKGKRKVGKRFCGKVSTLKNTLEFIPHPLGVTKRKSSQNTIYQSKKRAYANAQQRKEHKENKRKFCPQLFKLNNLIAAKLTN